jgi:hypothetical protein
VVEAKAERTARLRVEWVIWRRDSAGLGHSGRDCPGPIHN